MEKVSFIMAFGAGIFTFLSPCILPLIPVYISYLTGVSFRDMSEAELTEEKKRKIKLITALHALSFIVGFSVIFVFLGMSFSLLGKLLLEYQPVLKRIGGGIIVILALVIMGAIKIPFLGKEKHLSYKKEGVSIFGSMLVGAVFAAAWTPCVGPILGSILIYASSTANIKAGIMLLATFSMGLAVPFFLSALLINSLLTYIKRIEKYMRFVNIGVGTILMIFGVFLLKGG